MKKKQIEIDEYINPGENMKTYRERLGHEKYIDPGIDCSGDEPRTEQSHIASCDINTILAQYEKTGQFEDTPQTIEDAFGDFGDVPDLQTVLNVSIQAQDAFLELPARTRARFRNDPAELWNFLHDPENDDEARKLGLKTPKTPEVTHSEVSVSTVTSSKANASRVASTPKGADKKRHEEEE